MKIISLFKIMILAQLFFAVGVTMLSFVITANNPDAVDFIQDFNDFAEAYDVSDIKDEVTGQVENQQGIPVLDVGALVYYSGNLLISLLGNFIFAIPNMIMILVRGFQMIFNFPGEILAYLHLFTIVTISVMYVLGIIQLLTGLRSGRLI
jgi:hypothetical protein